MTKYKLTLRCNYFRHGPHKYNKTVDVDEDGGERLENIPNPPCPLCKRIIKKRDEDMLSSAPIAITPMEEWIEDGKAPGIIGRSNLVKAIDYTAEVTMKDFGLTDLRDARQGETMAPRLPGNQQKMADAFFNPGANPALGQNNRKRAAMVHRLGQKAIQGAYRSQALDVKSVLPDNRVALRKTSTEIVNQPPKR
ncbi:MAG TPA: hypothetical protein VGN16_09355 [Acidobacteriaceae bacterium]